MDECFRCGASDDKVRLYDAISNDGIVKICGSCSSEENFPIIKKPVPDNQIVQKPTLLKDKLSRMNKPSITQEVNLRGLIDKSLMAKKMQNYSDLIDNFHWVTQRTRRARKIPREQFAKEIDEPEENIKMIEQGILPGNDYNIINKIESYLGISLRKPGTSGFPDTDVKKKYILDNSLITDEESSKNLRFDPSTTKKLKISDLKEMEKYEDEEEYIESWEEEYNDNEIFLEEE